MRYSRQEILIGKEGQKKLSEKTVAIVGVGATGSVSSQLIVRAGVGKVIIVDRDIVELDNLQRQLLYNETDIGKPKAIIAERELKKLNSAVKINSYTEDLNPGNIKKILNGSDLILDCTDNFETRLLINDYCVKTHKPWIYSAGIKHQGTMMVFIPWGPCFRCIFKHPAGLDSCETAGILASTTTAIASFQVSNAVKMLLGNVVEQSMIRIDVWDNKCDKIKVHKRKSCVACQGIYEYLDGDKISKTLKMCGSNTYQIKGKEVNLKDIRQKVEKTMEVKGDTSFITFHNITVFKDGRTLVKANSEAEAKSLYSKFVGN
ncbi:MAG: ThiF family adenylyltransferase [archaeon]